MAKFIEVKSYCGADILINVDAISHIYKAEEWTNIEFVGDESSYIESSESYEEIKKKIENAGKTLIGNDIYI